MNKKGVVIPFFDYNNSNAIDSTNSFEEEIEIINEKENFEETLTRNDEFFVNMSHELKTPLNVIFSATQLMEMSLTDDSIDKNKGKIVRGVDSIKQNCYRLTKLINNMIDLSKIAAGNLNLNISDVNIVEVIENIVQLTSSFMKGKELAIIFNTSVEKKIIACDQDKIEKVILNLISNSIKFSNAGGKILVNIYDKGNNIEVSVCDNGIGIDEQNLTNIFNRFSMADKSLSRIAEGNGMGLSLTKSIIELHGGKINAQSKVGIGSVFKFELPCRISYNQNKIDEIMQQDNRNEGIRIELSDISK